MCPPVSASRCVLTPTTLPGACWRRVARMWCGTGRAAPAHRARPGLRLLQVEDDLADPVRVVEPGIGGGDVREGVDRVDERGPAVPGNVAQEGREVVGASHGGAEEIELLPVHGPDIDSGG